MPAWLWPTVAAISSVAGNLFGVHENRRSAARNENLANNAVSRRVDDLNRAGLNPALAYGQTAQVPTMQSSTDSGIGERAVSSASSAARLRQDMELQAAVIEKTKAEAQKAKAEANAVFYTDERTPSFTELEWAKRRALARDLDFAGAQQPLQRSLMQADIALRSAQASRERAGLSRAEFMSSLFDMPRSTMAWANESWRQLPRAVEAFRVGNRLHDEAAWLRRWHEERREAARRAESSRSQLRFRMDR